jgi:hypothetical protein
MENVGIFYDHLEYFTAIWYNLWPFSIVCGHLVYFSHFGVFGPRKMATLLPGCNCIQLFTRNIVLSIFVDNFKHTAVPLHKAGHLSLSTRR